MTARTCRGRDDGQVLPLYLAVIVSVTGLTLALIQVGSAHVLQRRAETAADAAALAAAERWGRGLRVSSGGLAGGSTGAAEDAAVALADENDADVMDMDGNGLARGWEVTVTVETEGGVIGGPVEAITGREVRSTSTARVAVAIDPLPLSPGNASLAVLERRAGVSQLRNSALVVYAGQSCFGGVDVDNLSDAMKVAILQVEDEVGPIELERGFALATCLARAGVAIPGLSPATRGDEIRLSPGQDDRVFTEFQNRGHCVDGTTVVVSTSLACQGRLGDLVTLTTRLVPNP